MRPNHPIHVFINREKYDFEDPEQTGASIKRRANIPLADALFRQRRGEDEVIANDATVTLKNGDHLHSQPAATYGLEADLLAQTGLDPDRVSVHPGPGKWHCLVISDYELPEGYEPNRVKLLIKLPPTFPDAAPDMFWVSPAVRAPGGGAPTATSSERLLNEAWQRFSWHLVAGEWKPGVSSLRDFLRCVRGRFLRLN